MPPLEPKDLLLYYAGAILLALLIFMRRRPRRGMRLRLREKHVGQDHERPLNVVFNYNGHSWDAYEVLGLPAGSSLERVESAFRESLGKVDPESRPFLEAAYKAIRAQSQARSPQAG